MSENTDTQIVLMNSLLEAQNILSLVDARKVKNADAKTQITFCKAYLKSAIRDLKAHIKVLEREDKAAAKQAAKV